MNIFFEDDYIGDGRFDGTHVTTHDGKKWAVNPNYISKSRLIDGDFLYVFMTKNNIPKFKVSTRMPRKLLITQVVCLGGKYYVSNGNKMLALFDSAVRFYDLREGDTIFALVSLDDSVYAAVDGIKQRATIDNTIGDHIPDPIDVNDIG